MSISQQNTEPAEKSKQTTNKKQKNMKKLFTLIVAICATTLAWADDSGSCGSNVTYTYVESTGTLTISGTGAMYNYTSWSSSPWYAYSSPIKNVVINNGVKNIGNYAFYCEGLTSITIPNSVTSIGDCAFMFCTGLTSITIPNSVTSIGAQAFQYCEGLTSITIPNSVTSIGSQAFSCCEGLASVTIGNSVTSIGSSPFWNSTGLTSINVAEDNLNYASIDGVLYSKDKKTLIKCPEGKTGSFIIPNSVTSIEDYAFYDCKGLTSITIPNSVINIGKYAFSGCTGLTSVTIPNSVTSIGDLAFDGCKGLTSVTIGNSVTSIGHRAFYCCGVLTSVTIPNSVTSIGAQAFESCKGLTSINVTEDNLNYASIDGVLYSKDKNTLITCPQGKTGSVTIPNSVTIIGEEAFSCCEGLTSVTIPNSVTSIGNEAFENCTGLTSVTIPSSVTSIGNSVFSNCYRLKSMTVEATTPPLCGYLGMSDISLYVPAGSIDAYKAADEWKRFKNIQAIPATGVKEVTAEKREVKKIIDRNGIIYIEKDGTRYFLNGDKVE